MVKISFEELKETLERCWCCQLEDVKSWHNTEGCPEVETSLSGLESLLALALEEHWTNLQLWHVEDRARIKNVAPEEIMRCKRKIDDLNQKRNNLIEKVDACLLELVTPLLPENPAKRYNTETIGSALDRMSIISIKIYHMDEQLHRTDVDQEHIQECCKKLDVLWTQQKDLGQSILELIDEYAQGKKKPKVYFQFKMYNDPNLNPELYEEKSK